MFLFYVLSFYKEGDTIQGGTLFKGGHHLRKYGNSENHRTVLTHVERGTYCYIFTYIVVLHTISIVKDYYGPFPPFLCWWLKWTFKFVPAGILLSFSVNILIRVSLKPNNFLESIVNSPLFLFFQLIKLKPNNLGAHFLH